jgi:hypothetical protein
MRWINEDRQVHLPSALQPGMKFTGAGDDVGRTFTAVTASSSLESPRTSDSSGHPQTSTNVVEGAFLMAAAKKTTKKTAKKSTKAKPKAKKK